MLRLLLLPLRVGVVTGGGSFAVFDFTLVSLSPWLIVVVVVVVHWALGSVVVVVTEAFSSAVTRVF